MKSCPQEYMTVCQELEQILTKPHVTVSPYFVQILCHFILFKFHDINCLGPVWNCGKPCSNSSIVSWDIYLNFITFCSSFMSRWHSMIRHCSSLSVTRCLFKLHILPWLCSSPSVLRSLFELYFIVICSSLMTWPVCSNIISNDV